MEGITRVAWFVLAVVHALPAAVLVVPSLTERLYGVPSDGTVGFLLVHRGALFLAVLLVCLLAAFDETARRAASVVVGVSVLAYLALYTMAGMPGGPLRTVALVDAIALIPLAAVILEAWRPVGAT